VEKIPQAATKIMYSVAIGWNILHPLVESIYLCSSLTLNFLCWTFGPSDVFTDELLVLRLRSVPVLQIIYSFISSSVCLWNWVHQCLVQIYL
jgi:hypothetical protein